MNPNRYHPTFIISFFLLLSMPLMGQNKRVHVEGTVVDSSAVALTGATVILLDQADSVLVSFSISDDKGRFLMKNVKPGDYVLQVTYLSYANYSNPVSVSVEQAVFNLGKITLFPENKQLDEVIVKAEHIPIMIKGDTIEYNAAAFQTKPNAVVEDLLRKLPGVEVERDGNIKAQGENVEKVFVDGEEFFGNDPKIASKNLPADAVDKVQVFDKKSEMAEFSGIDDGMEQKAINLKLKDDKKQGYFGNVTGGYGTTDRYEGKFNLNRFGKKTQFSVLGMGNNTNEQGFSLNDYINFMGGFQNMMSGGGGGGGAMKLSLNFSDGGVPLNMGAGDGLTTTWAGGLNFNRKWSSKTKLNSSYFYNNVKNDLERTVSRENLLENNSFRSEEENYRKSNSTNHRLNLTFRHEIDSFQNIILRSSVNFNDAVLTNDGDTRTFNGEGLLENSSLRNYDSDGERFSLNSNLIYRRKFNKKGRVFSADFGFKLNNDDRFGNLYAEDGFFIEDAANAFYDTTYQRQLFSSKREEYSARLSYTMPFLGKNKYLEINYALQNYSDNPRKEFYDRLIGTEVFNPILSNYYQMDYLYNKGGFNFRYNKEKFKFNSGLSLQQSFLKSDILSEEIFIKKDYLNLLPRMSMTFDFQPTRNLNLDYQTSVREPSVEELQPVVDNSDPLNVYEGNPELKPEYSHNLSLFFMNYDQFSFTNLFINAFATYTSNKITNARAVDSLFRQYTQPINVEDDFFMEAGVSFSTPIKPIKSRINLNANFRYNDGILFVNNIENNTKRRALSFDVSIENRKKEIVDIMLGANLGQNQTKYSVSEELDQKYLNQTYYADLSLNLGEKWSLGTSFDYTFYSGESFGDSQKVPLWKASLSNFIMKNKGQIKLTAFDLLNQNIGINRTSELNYIQEERIKSLGRYFLFSFSYSLSGFGKDGHGVDMKVVRRRGGF